MTGYTRYLAQSVYVYPPDTLLSSPNIIGPVTVNPSLGNYTTGPFFPGGGPISNYLNLIGGSTALNTPDNTTYLQYYPSVWPNGYVAARVDFGPIPDIKAATLIVVHMRMRGYRGGPTEDTPLTDFAVPHGTNYIEGLGILLGNISDPAGHGLTGSGFGFAQGGTFPSYWVNEEIGVKNDYWASDTYGYYQMGDQQHNGEHTFSDAFSPSTGVGLDLIFSQFNTSQFEQRISAVWIDVYYGVVANAPATTLMSPYFSYSGWINEHIIYPETATPGRLEGEFHSDGGHLKLSTFDGEGVPHALWDNGEVSFLPNFGAQWYARIAPDDTNVTFSTYQFLPPGTGFGRGITQQPFTKQFYPDWWNTSDHTWMMDYESGNIIMMFEYFGDAYNPYAEGVVAPGDERYVDDIWIWEIDYDGNIIGEHYLGSWSGPSFSGYTYGNPDTFTDLETTLDGPFWFSTGGVWNRQITWIPNNDAEHFGQDRRYFCENDNHPIFRYDLTTNEFVNIDIDIVSRVGDDPVNVRSLAIDPSNGDMWFACYYYPDDDREAILNGYFTAAFTLFHYTNKGQFLNKYVFYTEAEDDLEPCGLLVDYTGRILMNAWSVTGPPVFFTSVNTGERVTTYFEWDGTWRFDPTTLVPASGGYHLLPTFTPSGGASVIGSPTSGETNEWDDRTNLASYIDLPSIGDGGTFTLPAGITQTEFANLSLYTAAQLFGATGNATIPHSIEIAFRLRNAAGTQTSNWVFADNVYFDTFGPANFVVEGASAMADAPAFYSLYVVGDLFLELQTQGTAGSAALDGLALVTQGANLMEYPQFENGSYAIPGWISLPMSPKPNLAGDFRDGRRHFEP